MKPCQACGLPVEQELCNFCRRTVRLIRSQRCVSCTAPVQPGSGSRVEGKCVRCLERNQRLSAGTQLLLRRAAAARYSAKRAA